MRTIRLPFAVGRPILACGADLKGAFALAKGREAFLYEGFGDLGDADNLARYEKSIKKAVKDAKIRPVIIACDLHPGYYSTRFAEDSQLQAPNSMLCKIQHHEAHIASAIVDNGIKGKVIGVALDGTGFGTDGKIWGGEFFTGDPEKFERAAHFAYLPMPGGELAIREPWRMAAVYLYRAFGDAFLDIKIDLVEKIDKKRWGALAAAVKRGINAPLTSSAGRLFDAAASITLGKKEAHYEAELPVKFEMLADGACSDRYDLEVGKGDGIPEVDFRLTIRGIVKDLAKKRDSGTISAKFHNTVAAAITDICARLRKKTGIREAVLSGGVFQNKYLIGRVSASLKGKGFKVHTHSNFLTNDTGIAIGQLAIANARVLCV